MIPLAQQLRPKSLAEFVGQDHIVNKKSPLYKAISKNELYSMLFWGPPGVGKTTLANIIANTCGIDFVQLSAVRAGVKDIKLVVEAAKKSTQLVLFIDEIHSFNKSQQDALLPHIELGLITLIAATVHNPSFEVNSALLSRLIVYIFKPLSNTELGKILSKIKTLKFTTEAKNSLIKAAGGDARRLLNLAQLLPQSSKKFKLADLSNLSKSPMANFDKGGDIFYQQLSAFHKSVRGSSPDGALYWFARMIGGGADVKVIARRLLAIATEDVGNADPKALEICLNAWDTYHRLGDKEGHRAIAQAAVYCAVAAKSNATYLAWNKAQIDAQKTQYLAVPKHLCNAPDKLSKQLGLGKDYRYAHDEADAIAKGQTYFPVELGERLYYQPTDRGIESKIKQRLKKIRDD